MKEEDPPQSSAACEPSPFRAEARTATLTAVPHSTLKPVSSTGTIVTL